MRTQVFANQCIDFTVVLFAQASLNKEEFAAYAAACPEPVNPYPWQRESVDEGDGGT
jgi:hypothetical protein